MQRIGLVLKRGEPRALQLGDQIASYLHEIGKTVLIEQGCAEFATRWNALPVQSMGDEADLLVVLGGDGTILRAASLLNDKPMPVLGVNLGRVGFMAEVSPEEALAALKKTIAGTCLYSTRMLLQITLPDGKTARFLNEVVIHWGGIARLIDLEIGIGDSRTIESRADGLIIATPIGSSAYSYAANGPLVHPDMDAVLLTPICPYAGLKRPLLVHPDQGIRLLLKKGQDLALTLDGHTRIGLLPGQSLCIARAPLPFMMVKSANRDYFDVLKEKLDPL
jgi:NAD+ kinase